MMVQFMTGHNHLARHNYISSWPKQESHSSLSDYGYPQDTAHIIGECPDPHLMKTRGSRPALPGIQNIQQNYFFVNLQPHRWNPDLFNAHDYCMFWRHLTNFEAHSKSVKQLEIWLWKFQFFFPSAFLMEGMNSKTTKPITIPISWVFERYINHCCGCPECRVYPGHNRDLISSRDYPALVWWGTIRSIYTRRWGK